MQSTILESHVSIGWDFRVFFDDEPVYVLAVTPPVFPNSEADDYTKHKDEAWTLRRQVEAAYSAGVRDAAERIKSRLPNVPVIGGYIAEEILSLLDGKGAGK